MKPLGLVLALVVAARSLGAADRLPVSDAVMHRPWKAQWIACAGAPDRDAGVYRFRKVLDLAQVPAHFPVHVSADQRFVLSLNGQRVGIGPSRGDLYYWRFETFDLGPLLKPGKNLLVAQVWNFGKDAPSAQVTDRTGFIAEADSDAEAAVRTDATWQCAAEPGHQPWPEGAAALHAAGKYFVVGPGERLDAALYDWDWSRLPVAGTEGGRWKPAVSLGGGNPRSIREAPGWALTPEGRWLVPDELPPMEYRKVSAGSVARIESTPDMGAFSPDGLIPAKTKVTILFDRKELVAAYPRLSFSRGRGAKVRLSYQEALVKDGFAKGNRNEISDKHLLGLSDLVLPDGGAGRVFEPLWWRTWRFLEVEVETAAEPLVIEGLEAYATGFPFAEKGRFDAGDPTLARIWETGWRTARLCAHETYMDCPYYEQLQYVGDTRVQALISYAVAGDDRLARQAIAAYDHSRRSDGITSSRYPSNPPQYIPPFSLLWVGMVHDFWRYRDDPAFVKQMLPGTRSVLDFYLAHQREDGLVGFVPWWSFIDWTVAFAAGVPPQEENGGSTSITLQMVNALREAADFEATLGDRARAAAYRQAAQKAVEAVVRLCWDESKGLVADTRAKAQFSQQANILAVLADATPAGRRGSALDKILAEPMLSSADGASPATGATANKGLGLAKASYYFRFYLARALESTGRGDEYLPQLEPWREMLSLGLSTWAETPELSSRSDCHAWSAHPNYDLLTIVAGIKPGSPGFKTVRIEPHLGSLDRLNAAFPHPSGEITVSYRRYGTDVGASVALPAGLTGELVWHGKTYTLAGGAQELRLPGN
jgi:alpha-L-rhamnosidase